jgi:DNA modification methylase
MSDWKSMFSKDNIYYETDNGILYKGDCLEVMKEFPNESIDLVLTDPPYLKKFLYTYSYLADCCPNLMKDGASLLTIIGHYALHDIVKMFDGKLKYRWMFCMNQEDGKHPRMAMGIEVMWKPVLWYVKRAYLNGRGFIRDMVKITKEDGVTKKYHKWQQSEQWAEFFISKLTKEDDIVLDPYFGSGTVGFVCEKLNRKWIGIELEEKYCEITVQRLKELNKFNNKEV